MKRRRRPIGAFADAKQLAGLGPEMCVSVVMTVYNGQRFLAEAVESVLNQTVPDFELIAVDDGSTDATPQILSAYAGRDPRVKVVTMNHVGRAKALNAGFRQAQYELVANTDCDDRMLPDRLEKQAAFLKKQPTVHVACGNCYFINTAGRRIGTSCCRVDVERGRKELRPALFLELIHSTVLMRKDALLKIGGYCEDLEFAEDRDLWGRFATSGYSIECQNDFLTEYRLHSGAMTMERAAVQHELHRYTTLNVKRRLMGQSELSLHEFQTKKQREPVREHLRQRISVAALHSFHCASRHYGEGEYWKCALSLAAAVCLNPPNVLGRLISRLQGR